MRQFVTLVLSLKSPLYSRLVTLALFSCFRCSESVILCFFFFFIIHPFLMMDHYVRVPTIVEFWLPQEQFGFLLEHGVMIPVKGSSIYDYSRGKVEVPVPLFEVVLRLPTSDFFDMIVHHYDFSVDELTLSAVNKIVGFKLICRSLGCIPTFCVFSYFFCASTKFGVRTLAKRWVMRQLIIEQDNPKKIWQRQWLWVNQNLTGQGFHRTRDFPDHLSKLFGDNLVLGKWLGNITVVEENWKDFILVAAGMSVAWRAHGKMAQLFFVRDGICSPTFFLQE